MTKVATILGNAATALNDDKDHLRWSLPELKRYLDDGLLELLKLSPRAFSETRVHLLTPGSRQTVEGMYAVLDVSMNVDRTDPTVLKRMVRLISREHLDNFDREWQSTTPTALVSNAMLDGFMQERFWVYPPSDGTGAVEIEVAITPESVSVAPGDDPKLMASYDIDLPIDAIYAPTLTYYVLHRAWAKDADYAANQQNSNKYYELFQRALGSSGRAVDGDAG